MKVLCVLPSSIGGRLTTNSILSGLVANGCDTVVYDELSPDESLLNGSYDFVIGYDFSALILKTQYGLHFPTANYFSDVIEGVKSGVYWKEYYNLLNDNENYVFYWDRVLTQKSKLPNIHYIPHFVDCSIYKDLGLFPEYDVMFAGRLDTDFRLNSFLDIVKALPQYNFAWYAFERHFEDALSRANKCDKELLKKCYKGFVDNERDMAIAINKCRMVFNMNYQGESSLNYRTIQTVACKRLLLSDWRLELDMFDGKMPFYKNFDELKEKICYYLENKSAYDDVVSYCYNCVLGNHNSTTAVAYILDTMFGKNKV